MMITHLVTDGTNSLSILEFQDFLFWNNRSILSFEYEIRMCQILSSKMPVMLQNGHTHLKNLADARFMIRFKIICCKILKAYLTICGF